MTTPTRTPVSPPQPKRFGKWAIIWVLIIAAGLVIWFWPKPEPKEVAAFPMNFHPTTCPAAWEQESTDMSEFTGDSFAYHADDGCLHEKLILPPKEVWPEWQVDDGVDHQADKAWWFAMQSDARHCAILFSPVAPPFRGFEPNERVFRIAGRKHMILRFYRVGH
jgi:hypothetical protein